MVPNIWHIKMVERFSVKQKRIRQARLISINKNSKLLKGIDNGSQVWMSHADTITKLPPKSKIGSTEDVEMLVLSLMIN